MNKEEQKKPLRTPRQSRALHLYFELLAEQLNDAGLTMTKVLKEGVEIEWNKDLIKNYLWRPIQDFCLGKGSTTELNTDEITEIYEMINRQLSNKFPEMEHIDFPHEPEPLPEEYPTENNDGSAVPF